MKRRSLLPLLAAAPLLPATVARAQQAPLGPSWSPDRPVRFVVGFAPGGSTDTTARVVAQAIAPGLGQPVVVENRTGAAGNVATEHVARSAPDGHTLVVASMGSHATNAALYRDLPFDVARDFAPVSLVALSACLLVVHPSVPAHSVSELVARAKASPGALNCGIAGAGSSQHFAAALFEHRAGVRFTQVSYRGGAPAMADLVSGRLDLMFTPVVEAIQQVRSGQVRALGTTGRSAPRSCRTCRRWARRCPATRSAAGSGGSYRPARPRRLDGQPVRARVPAHRRVDHRRVHARRVHLGQQLLGGEGMHLAVQAARRAAGPDVHLRVDDPHGRQPAGDRTWMVRLAIMSLVFAA
jgi:tripartite-type tricarboxylate transporter receptor subunit TctC